MIWTFLSHLPWFWEKFEIEGRTILWNCNLFQEDNEPIRTLFYTNNTSNEGKFEKYCSFKTNSKLNLKKRKEILRYRVNGNWICIKIFIQMWKRCISIPRCSLSRNIDIFPEYSTITCFTLRNSFVSAGNSSINSAFSVLILKTTWKRVFKRWFL